MSLKQEIKFLQVECEKNIIHLAQVEFDVVIKPWLIKKNYRFSAGMGMWCIWDNNDMYISRDYIPKKVLDILEIDMPNQELGSLLKDFDPNN